ncbi:MAG: UDP-N-acetylmuramoyl-L-alanine--D-glutamate ligase [Candidatus Kuenenbacteria bacterium]
MKDRVFKFKKYNFSSKTGTAVFEYTIDDKLKFKEKLVFSKPFKKLDKNKLEAFDMALFNLFLIAGISYYKIYCPKIIDLGDYKLTKEQANFWNKVYTKGLGEFFYVNKIDYRGLVKFPYDKEYNVKPVSVKVGNRSLVPFGGGKDSIVTLETLKEKGVQFNLFSLRDLAISREAAQATGENLLVVEREISPNLFKLNKIKGVYNGHIPFSAYTAFLSVLASILYGYRSIVLSNEKSSNYGNVKYLSKIINHQWSKSYEFEKMFSDYLKKFITPSIKYYSLLRKYSELQIVEKFVKYKKYFPIFSSCNLANFKLSGAMAERWCGKCPKCVFVWTMLSAYLPKDELIKIFKKDITKNKRYKVYLKELLGEKNHKPFECVGTPEETKKALEMANKNKYLILGFGREGLSSYKYLRRKYPKMIIGIADKNALKDFDKQYRKVLKKDKNLELYLGKNYLKSLDKFRVVVKSPGIKLKKSRGASRYALTSNLNIFLKDIQGKVIGVTGSKGKSTSASLIYHILKKYVGTHRWCSDVFRHGVFLIGNIGKPSLNYLSKDSKNTIFVIEISSYQLESLAAKKIDVALITSFFPEHLDYHGSLNEYFKAKMNIVLNLKDKGVVVYNKKYKRVGEFVGAYCNTPLRSIGCKGEYKGKTKLFGRHNLENILGVVEVVKLFDVRKKKIEEAVKSFKSLEHRLEYVGKFREIEFYNDVLSTTPESTIEAIDALKDKNLETIIVGGFDRGLDYRRLARKIVGSKIKNVILWPHSGSVILSEVRSATTNGAEGSRINLMKVKNMQETVRACYKYTSNGGTVLLSPAASSYDFYRDYREKGKEFKRLVGK